MDNWIWQSLDGPSFPAPNFVSVTSSMGVLFPILRRVKVSTLVFVLLEFHEFHKLYLMSWVSYVSGLISTNQ